MFDPLFLKLAAKYPTPHAVQTLLQTFSYNHLKNPHTVYSAKTVWKKKSAHCLESAFFAAAILEVKGYSPLVMSLESVDALDHVVYIFRSRAGKWGAIGLSRDRGLQGRAPVFRSPRDLALSYFDPYIDQTGRVTGYGVAHLDDSETPWRDSPRNVWKAEKYLIHMPHKTLYPTLARTLKATERRYQRGFAAYQANGPIQKLCKNWW